MTAVASRIGCGFAECPHGPTYVCNYLYGYDEIHFGNNVPMTFHLNDYLQFTFFTFLYFFVFKLISIRINVKLNIYRNEYDLGHPYLEGERCGDCPSKCSDGLCGNYWFTKYLPNMLQHVERN